MDNDIPTFYLNLTSGSDGDMEEALFSAYNNDTSSIGGGGEEDTGFFKYAWWQYFIIPWVAGFVGYGTNVLGTELFCS